MLTTVLNDSPIFPENEEEQADLSAPLLMDSPQVSIQKLLTSTDIALGYNNFSLLLLTLLHTTED